MNSIQFWRVRPIGITLLAAAAVLGIGGHVDRAGLETLILAGCFLLLASMLPDWPRR